MAEAGRSGRRFDDGIFEGVRKVFVREDSTGVVFLKLVYEKCDGERVEVKHGIDTGIAEEFAFDYPDEYITSVDLTVGHFFALRTLVFETSNGRRSRRFGSREPVNPELPVRLEGGGRTPAVVGFYGRFGEDLVELKAHLGPPPPQKQDLVGGGRGIYWSDGKHEHVTKIRVGRGIPGLSFIQFGYRDGNRDVSGEIHGKVVKQPIEEFDLEGDFLVSVDVYRDNIGKPDECITALEFKTYGGKTKRFGGIACGQKISLHAYKIVRFHGRSGDKLLHSLGVFQSFSPVIRLDGLWIKLEQKRRSPGPRRSNAIAQVGENIYSFGGETSNDQPMIKEMHVFNCGTKTWSTAPATGPAPDFACVGASMVPIGSKLYVYGGLDRSGKYSSFHSFDTITNEWKLLEDQTTRTFHSMAAIENTLYIFGGVSSRGPLKTLAGYDTRRNVWLITPIPDGSFAARERAGLLAVEGKLWVLFGRFNGRVLDDIHCYDPATLTWTQMQTSGEKPSPRSGFASGVSGENILVFGGETRSEARTGGQVFSGLYSLDTRTLKWERVDKYYRARDTSPSPRGLCNKYSLILF